MTVNPTRVPAGVRTGGQFAATKHAEPTELKLDSDPKQRADDIQWRLGTVNDPDDITDDDIDFMVGYHPGGSLNRNDYADSDGFPLGGMDDFEDRQIAFRQAAEVYADWTTITGASLAYDIEDGTYDQYAVVTTRISNESPTSISGEWFSPDDVLSSDGGTIGSSRREMIRNFIGDAVRQRQMLDARRANNVKLGTTVRTDAEKTALDDPSLPQSTWTRMVLRAAYPKVRYGDMGRTAQGGYAHGDIEVNDTAERQKDGSLDHDMIRTEYVGVILGDRANAQRSDAALRMVWPRVPDSIRAANLAGWASMTLERRSRTVGRLSRLDRSV